MAKLHKCVPRTHLQANYRYYFGIDQGCRS